MFRPDTHQDSHNLPPPPDHDLFPGVYVLIMLMPRPVVIMLQQSLFLLNLCTPTLNVCVPVPVPMSVRTMMSMVMMVKMVAVCIPPHLCWRFTLRVLGLTLQAVGMGWFALIAEPSIDYASLLAPLIVSGVGVSMAIPAAQNSAVGSVTLR